MRTDPAPYTDINAFPELLLARMRAILGDALIGLFLYGSLAAGDFDVAGSDIDFVAATSAEMDERALAVLKGMHEELVATGGQWGERLSGGIICDG
ncbi:MAG TPA: hypothetical protein VKQ30_08310 [Ktedonobacterales bacterium]|nr:hypothetical protein [Ktedonobacterales bacterium]